MVVREFFFWICVLMFELRVYMFGDKNVMSKSIRCPSLGTTQILVHIEQCQNMWINEALDLSTACRQIYYICIVIVSDLTDIDFCVDVADERGSSGLR
jgi:hypothetical protein